MASEEQVRRLREQSGADEASCRMALERSGGDLLDAFLYLERQGKCTGGGAQGSFTTAPAGMDAAARMALASVPEGKGKRGGKTTQEVPEWKDILAEVWRMGVDLLRRAVVNQLEVWRGGRMMTSVPVLIVVLLLIVAFWVVVPLLIVGLLMGCRYRFAGPDLGSEKVGRGMDAVSATVDEVVEQVKQGFRENGKKS